MPNLDMLAAKRAQKIISRTKKDKAKPSEVDNTVTKTLGILQENGLYASVLFLLSRPKKELPRAKVILEEMLILLSQLGFEGWDKPKSLEADQVLPYISDTISQQLERLILAKDTAEQMLIYARYGAKARSAEEPDSEGGP